MFAMLLVAACLQPIASRVCTPNPPQLPTLVAPKERKVFDVVTFMDEVDILALRVLTLHDFVDTFVVGVCNTTFSKHHVDFAKLSNVTKLKEIYDEGRLVTVPCGDDVPVETDDPWKRESYLRDNVMKHALQLTNRSDDIFIFTDVDEMPAPQTLKHILGYEVDAIIGLHMPLYKYHYGCLLNADSCAGTIFTHALAAQKGGNELRYLCGSSPRPYACAGWHCSNCMPVELIQHKFYSFSHYKDSNFPDSMKTIEYIKDGIATCSHGPSKYTCTEDVEGLPPLIWTSDFAAFRPHSCPAA